MKDFWLRGPPPGSAPFTTNLWRTTICLGALVVAFALNIRAEDEIRRANELRHRSFLLADELRQSGDDLTRMARTYVVTADPVYKAYFQDILDIRDGRRPRPEAYWRPYWDLVEGPGVPPRPDLPAVPLLELMKEAGFTHAEFQDLAEAKAQSDGLTIPEFEAMRLVESAGPGAPAWTRARDLLYGEAYHRAKRAVMGPINRFLARVDERTLAAVTTAERRATAFRAAFAGCGLMLMFLLWQSYAALRKTLGGPVDEMATRMDRARREAEENATRQNLLLSALINSAGDIVIFSLDREYRYTAFNEKHRQEMLSVWKAPIHVGLSLLECMTDDQLRSAAKASIDRALGGETFTEVHRQPGIGVCYEFVWSPIRQEPGQVSGVTAFIRDVTERERVEQALRTSEQEFRSLAEAMPQIVWVTRPDGWNTYFNQQWVEYTGLTLEESYGNGWNTPFHPEDRQRAWDAWQRATTHRDTYSLECRLRRADGSYRWWLIRGVPLCDSADRILKWFGTCTDIEDIKKAEAEIRALNSELEQRVSERTAELEAANRELEAFSYSVSHDLRAPLRAIDGYGRILIEDFGECLDGEGRRLLSVISSEIRRMGQLVDDLLAFSRLSRQRIDRSRIDMSALAQSVFDEHSAREVGRAFEFKVADLPPVQGDRAMMRVALGNLVSNAIKFTKPRSPAIIEIGGRIDEGMKVYWVKDNGVGFDMKYSPKLFGVFQRLHSADEFEGTGVGLALVQRVIHRQGGRVWGEGEPGRGATFSFSLPDQGE